jgi:phytoene synthase
MRRQLRLMAQAGKTFFFAAFFLDANARLYSALAYNFCRAVDDISDHYPELVDRSARLRAIADGLATLNASNPVVEPVVPLIEMFPSIQQPLISLVEACLSDTSSFVISDLSDLLRYAHGVAGNVGLIMYPILGGVDPEGLSHAANLGIAMQFTNIARDILEDRRRGRVYLPAEWLGGHDLLALSEDHSRRDPRVIEATSKLLKLADQRYEHGIAGLEYLLPCNRFAIEVAARCYAAIGTRVIVDSQLAQHRAFLPLHSKALIACRAKFVSSRAAEYLLERN